MHRRSRSIPRQPPQFFDRALMTAAVCPGTQVLGGGDDATVDLVDIAESRCR